MPGTERRHAAEHASPAPGAAHVLLVGGPADLPPELRRHFLHTETDTVSIPHRGGHEHFVCVTSTRGTGRPPVYQWTGRTPAPK